MRFAPGRREIVAGGRLRSLLAGALIWVLVRHRRGIRPPSPGDCGAPSTQADAGLDRDRLTDLHADGTANIGTQLLSDYLVPFEVVSLLLLAVLIGASYLARPRVPPHRTLAEGPGARSAAADPDERRQRDERT